MPEFLDLPLTTALLVGLALVILFFTILAVRPGRRVHGGVSLFNRLKFWFKASDPPPKPQTLGSTTSIGPGATVVAHDIVAGDKIVNISPAPTESTHSTPGPALSLRLFLRDRPYSTSLLARRDASGQFPFGFALINTTPGAPASNIRITVDIYWRGTDLRGTPKFKTHEYPRGWTSARGQITNAQPATFVFHGPAITSFPAHAEEWPNFTGEIDVAAVGRFIMSYVVSSASPASESRGDLTIELE